MLQRITRSKIKFKRKRIFLIINKWAEIEWYRQIIRDDNKIILMNNDGCVISRSDSCVVRVSCKSMVPIGDSELCVTSNWFAAFTVRHTKQHNTVGLPQITELVIMHNAVGCLLLTHISGQNRTHIRCLVCGYLFLRFSFFFRIYEAFRMSKQ